MIRTTQRRSRVLRACGLAVTVAGSVLLVSMGVAAPPSHAETLREQQWHIKAMRLSEAWEISQGEGVTVAVIDNGVDSSVPDLRGQVLEGRDFSGQPGTADEDVTNHGTGIAALIAGTGNSKDGQGPIGVAPEAKILPLRILDDTKAQNEEESALNFSAQLSKAIRYAADTDARVINISQGTRSTSKAVQKTLQEAVDYALLKNKLIFASSGNSGKEGNPVEYPAGIPGVIGVGALDKNGDATAESTKGPQVALSAAGMDMVHACTGGTGFCESHGTSDATALVSGSAALVWAAHPDWTNNQVLRVLLNTAGKPASGDERNDYIGYGAVRPRVALQNPGDPGPADVNPLLPVANSASPTSSATKSEPTTETSAAAADKESANKGGAMGIGVAIGIGVAVLAGVAVVFIVIRRNRNRNNQPPTGPAQPNYRPGTGFGPSPTMPQQPKYPTSPPSQRR